VLTANTSRIPKRRTVKFRFGPNGLHIFNRNTGLNIVCDEVSVPPALWARVPRTISVAITNRCDLRCAYCYAPKNHSSLNFDLLVAWLHELDSNGCFGVGFGGGEPTLYEQFVDLCKRIAEETALAVSFTTHSHHLSGKVVDALSGTVNFIRVSMDGVGNTYERARGRPFSALRSQLDLVRGLAPFGINFVVNAMTFPDLIAAVELASELGAADFLLLPERPVHGEGGIDPHTRRSLQQWIAAYKEQLPLAISEGDVDPSCYPTFTSDSGLRAYAHIDACGLLKRSSYDREGIVIGPDGVLRAIEQLNAQAKG
jgi:MoaA/NifB/PqqE/SkfB family radical SAM enzyme